MEPSLTLICLPRDEMAAPLLLAAAVEAGEEEEQEEEGGASARHSGVLMLVVSAHASARKLMGMAKGITKPWSACCCDFMRGLGHTGGFEWGDARGEEAGRASGLGKGERWAREAAGEDRGDLWGRAPGVRTRGLLRGEDLALGLGRGLPSTGRVRLVEEATISGGSAGTFTRRFRVELRGVITDRLEMAFSMCDSRALEC